MEFSPAALYQSLLLDTETGSSLDSLRGTGIYPPDLSARQYAILSLSNSLLKKFSGAKTKEADSRALDKFLSADRLSGSWELRCETPLDELLVNGFRDRLWRFFQRKGFQLEFGPDRLVHRGRLGPGSNIGARGQDFYTKLFDSPLTSTSTRLYRSYRRYCSSNRLFCAAEMQRLRFYEEVSVEQGNRLSFVPKTTAISRTIATEPTLNMWFQLASADLLNDQLRREFGIDLATQPELNREMARVASLDGSFATIDLESASDSVSTAMLKWALPPEIFRDLSLYRSPMTRLPDGTWHELKMFSSMGNGYTFSLQTVIFSCVVCSVYHLFNQQVVKSREGSLGNFGVFGDDIICRAHLSRHVVRLLNILGFRVNEHKSFSEGPFRESCGADFFSGVNVRGVYLKGTEAPSIYAAINMLIDFSARHQLVLKRTITYLRKFVRYVPVPYWENQDAGLKTPLSFFKPKLDKNGSYAYYAFRPVPKVLRFSETQVLSPRGSRKRRMNEAGAELSYLAGVLRNLCIPIRHDRVRYRLRLSVAPNWETSSNQTEFGLRTILYGGKTGASPSGELWRRWESAFYSSL